MSNRKEDIDNSNEDVVDVNVKKKFGQFSNISTISNQPLYFTAGHNGVNLVEKALVERGWRRCQEKSNPQVKLFWTELVGQVNYSSLRDGDQMANHIPNCGLITNKLGLLLSLRDFERLRNNSVFLSPTQSNQISSGSTAVDTTTTTTNTNDNSSQPRVSFGATQQSLTSMHDFVPETYIVDDFKEREAFFAAYQDGDIWIYKPTGSNQGKGISLVRDLPQFKESLRARDEEAKRSFHGIKARIVQRYIKKPLLINNRKFDIRCYMLIASTVPYLVLFHPGYLRLSIHEYLLDNMNLTVHLTNQFIQKKDPAYHDVKDDTVWSMQKFNQYINENVAEEKKLPKDWVMGPLEKQMQKIMLHVFNSVKSKLYTRLGLFELYGFDFMIDDNMKVWLIEVNVNPAMHTNCTHLSEILPPLIAETLDIALECFEKSKRDKPLLPLQSVQKCTILYHQNNANRQRCSPQTSVNYWQPPRFRSQSQSPHRSNVETTTTTATTTNMSASIDNAGNSSAGPSNDRTVPLPVLSTNRNFENSLRRYEPRSNWNYKSLPRNAHSPSYLPPVFHGNNINFNPGDSQDTTTVKKYTFRPSVGGSKFSSGSSGGSKRTNGINAAEEKQQRSSASGILHSLSLTNNSSNTTREVVKLSTVQVVTNASRSKQQQTAGNSVRPMPDTVPKKTNNQSRRVIDFSA